MTIKHNIARARVLYVYVIPLFQLHYQLVPGHCYMACRHEKDNIGLLLCKMRLNITYRYILP